MARRAPLYLELRHHPMFGLHPLNHGAGHPSQALEVPWAVFLNNLLLELDRLRLLRQLPHDLHTAQQSLLGVEANWEPQNHLCELTLVDDSLQALREDEILAPPTRMMNL